MKRLFTICGSLLLCAYANAYGFNLYDFEENGIYYNILSEEDKTCEVTYNGYTYYIGSITIPSIANSYSVISIGPFAFESSTELTNIFIPNSITSIGSSAFENCSGLTNITIPNSVASIGDLSFWKCTNLTSVIIPNSVTTIGEQAFSECSNLTSVTIPNSVTALGEQAFSGCSNLTSVTISNSVTALGKQAFSGCSNLTSVIIPNSVTAIGEQAFSECSNLTSVIIPNSVTSIKSQAFSGCTNLTNITIPISVTNIGGDVFYDCGNLRRVFNQSSCSLTFGYSASDFPNAPCIYTNCTSELSGDFLLSVHTDGTKYVCDYYGSEKTITLPSVDGVEKYAFYERTDLTSVIIPSSITSIGMLSFCNCSNLDNITIPNNVISIGSGAFENCKNLSNIDLPNSLTKISSLSFYNCSKLSNIVVPNNVLSIEDQAFYECTGLKDVTISNSVTKIGEKTFYGCKSLSIIVIPNNVESIGLSAFLGCTSLTSISLPENLTKIEPYLFFSCSKLQNITIPNTVTSIGSYSFANCSNLTNIILPSRVSSIDTYAFAWCTYLTSFTIPQSVTSIGSSAFNGCTGLTSVTISMQDEADFASYLSRSDLNDFSDLPGEKHIISINGIQQTEIKIPSSVTSIGSYAFSKCTEIKSITIPSSVTSIGSSAFSSCTGLTSLTIPNSVTTIGDKAFSGCSSLMSVTNYATTPQTITATTFPDQGTLHVLSGYGETFQVQTGWKNFLIKEDATLPVEEEDADTYTIADGTDYTSTALTHVTTLKYSRTFSNTKWQALYIPFALPYSDISADLDIAWLNNVHMYDDNGDNEPDRTTLEFYIMNSGTTEPNTPYLVRAHSSGTFSLTLSDVDVSPAVCNPFECSTFTQTFTVYGTYIGVTGADMVSNKYYAPANGSLCYTTNTSASLKPQRWYLKVSNKDGSAVTNLAPSIRVMIDGEMLDEEETAISNLSASPLSGSYVSIDGRSVSNPTAPGLYVHNNKKVFIR